ncbi:MAG: recombinase family protein [Lachnospiraceae bacterium]|nr:recombinase family protein [Lachnospiraceae bacterium]MDE6253530.1 recombinase family protein [Lachnospiraceae bacterium]
MSEKNIYNTALYLRLSRDDTDIDGRNKTESDSISSQRDLLRAFVQSHDDLQIFDIYIDDGYSGADFKRPEFIRMMADISSGKVNCVLVKDLSRFGRDYIEAGRLIQKTFPAFNVRFIAVTDNYDSLSADKTDTSLILPVKNFVNDSYCRDISMKVKAHQKVKRLEGKCISAFTVYGYLKNPDDKNQLIVDDYAANIVKKIYAWKISGMSLFAIANKLNSLGILSPMEYKKSLGMKYSTGFEGVSTAKWSAISIKRILTNRVYIGDMEQGKQEKVSYKVNKRVKKAEQEWIRVRNTHEAIISERNYNIVQELLQFDSRISTDTETANLFSGILFCADCKAPMVKRINNYKGNKKVFYICQTKNRSLGCSRHSIKEDVLKSILLKEIKLWLDLMASYSDVMDMITKMNIDYEQVVEYNTQIGTLRNEYNKYYKLISGLLTDLKEGLIDKAEFEEFQYLYTKKCEELEITINNQKEMIKKMFQNGVAAKTQLDKFRETADLGELTRELLVTMIRRVYVHEDKSLDIVFRFSSQLEKIEMIL